nr:hypothetical protein CFP56_32350 [Quercus suber]
MPLDHNQSGARYASDERLLVDDTVDNSRKRGKAGSRRREVCETMEEVMFCRSAARFAHLMLAYHRGFTTAADSAHDFSTSVITPRSGSLATDGWQDRHDDSSGLRHAHRPDTTFASSELSFEPGGADMTRSGQPEMLSARYRCTAGPSLVGAVTKVLGGKAAAPLLELW